MNHDFTNYLDNALEFVTPYYNSKSRHYHNLDHVYSLFKKIDDYVLTMYVTDGHKERIEFKLKLAAIFHDAIYSPLRNDNEEKSCELFKSYYLTTHENPYSDSAFDSCFHFQDVVSLIMATKETTSKLSELTRSEIATVFRRLDREILSSNNLNELIQWEHGIFKEYSMFRYQTYKEKRIDFLMNNRVDNGLIEYVKNRKINLGLFVGTFNPFHIGHQNILEKSSQLFDKVIVVPSTNPEKQSVERSDWKLENYEIIKWEGLLYSLYQSLPSHLYSNITFIRGIRNSSDYAYESNWMSWMIDLFNTHNLPTPKFVLIPCDKQYEHISSSALRSLRKFNVKEVEQYIT